MPVSGTVLGLGCGQPHGSAEILLKAALRAAEAEGAAVELVRLDELRLPSGAAEGAEPDDAWWLWERLVGCDGLIVSTPIISRTVAARLKLFGDRLLGPNADAAIIEGLTALRREGREPAVPFRVDERVLKPRVAGFLAVGGSLTSQWKTLALPIMHTTTFSMHIAVVDQVQFEGPARRAPWCSTRRRSTGPRCSGATSPASSGWRSTRRATWGRPGSARCATSTSWSCAPRTSSAPPAARAACWRRTSG